MARPLETVIAAKGNAAKMEAKEETAAVDVMRASWTWGARPSSMPTGTNVRVVEGDLEMVLVSESAESEYEVDKLSAVAVTEEEIVKERVEVSLSERD